MICRNLRSVTPPIDYPLENGGFEATQSSSKINVRSGNMTNVDMDDNQDQMVLYIDGRRIVRKKKRKCIKCKFRTLSFKRT